MNCRTVLPLLSGYVDRELSQAESEMVRDHLHTCTSCKFEHDRFAATKESLRAMVTLAPPVGLEARLHQSVFASKRRPANKSVVFGLIAASSMAAAFLAVQLSGKPSAPEQPLAHQSTQELDMAANSAYLSGSDPMGGGVPVVTVGYAGGH